MRISILSFAASAGRVEIAGKIVSNAPITNFAVIQALELPKPTRAKASLWKH
jgi:hypothetical protein